MNKRQQRVFISSLIQESNSFSPRKTTLDLFRRGYLLRAGAIADALRGTNTEIGGFFSFAAERDGLYDLIPGIAAWAVAAGPITREAFETLADQLVHALRRAMPIDAVLLALHGSLVCESVDDCEGELLKRVRKLIGDRIPIAVTLDYHANVTAEMVRLCSVMVGFRTYPHVDFHETGVRAFRALERLLEQKRRPFVHFDKLPLIVPVEDSETGSGVCHQVIQRLERLDRDENVVAASLFCSQPWIDVPEVGVSLLVYTNNRAAVADEMAAIRAILLDNRQRFFTAYPSAAQALEQARASARPVILVDTGDITTAGGAGDSTVVLRALLENPPGMACVLNVVDAKSVTAAVRAGENATADLRVGGSESGYNARVALTARVLRLTHERSEVKGPSMTGVKVDLGRRALVCVDGWLYLVLTEYASLLYDPQQLRDMGLHPEKMGLIVQKSHKLFRAAYRDIAQTVLTADTPGCTDKNLQRLPFRRVTRPVFPLDDI